MQTFLVLIENRTYQLKYVKADKWEDIMLFEEKDACLHLPSETIKTLKEAYETEGFTKIVDIKEEKNFNCFNLNK
jgi:hypothetical protein